MGAEGGTASHAETLFREPNHDRGASLSAGGRVLDGPQASLKLLLLLLELLKLGFSVRLVGIDTAPAFSETHAESSFTPPNPTFPLLFVERVPMVRSQRELEAWWVNLFPTKVGSLEGRVGERGVGVFGGAFFDVVVLPSVVVFIGTGFDVVLLVVVP